MVEDLARHAASSDVSGWLHPEQQALIHDSGWLKMLAPRSLGGGEMALPDVVRLEEQIAAVDGSAGWVVTLCAGAGWFAGFLPPSFARQVMATPRVCVAGSGAVTGFADAEGEGYRISGTWDFASGAPMATHFTCNAALNGTGETRAFIVPAGQVQILPTWASIGMRATASHSYRIENQWVSRHHAFVIAPEHATAPGPLYRYPFYSLAYFTLAANLAGIATHFIALAEPMVSRRQPSDRAAPYKARLQAARDAFYATLDRTWQQVVEERALSTHDTDAVRTVALALAAVSRAAVDELYPFCGLAAAHRDSEINRVWRDFHTATQHNLLLA